MTISSLDNLSRETVETLLAAGVDVLRMKGPEGVTVPEVARRAGLPSDAVERHFGNQEALAEAVYRKQLGAELRRNIELSAELRDELPSAAVIDRTLRASVERHASVRERAPDYYSAAEARGALATSDPDALSEAFEYVAESIARSREEVRVRHPEVAAWLVTTGVDAVFRECLLRRPELLTDPHFVQELIDLVKLYLLAERPD